MEALIIAIEAKIVELQAVVASLRAAFEAQRDGPLVPGDRE